MMMLLEYKNVFISVMTTKYLLILWMEAEYIHDSLQFNLVYMFNMFIETMILNKLLTF